MLRHVPEVLEHLVHGAAVVELLLKLMRVAGELDVDKDADEGAGDVFAQRVGIESLLTMETERREMKYWKYCNLILTGLF